METNSILRLSFIIGNGQAKTFKTNLLHLIRIAIFDNEVKTLTIDEIRKNIKLNYELDFTNEEIEDAIKSQNSGIIKINDEDNFKYCLHHACLGSLTNKVSEFSIDRIIDRYINENKDINKDKLNIIIRNFLYNSFNDNKQTLLNLINKNYNAVFQKIDLTNEEKEIVNKFLNWSNKEKDIFIYNTIAYGVDYCMLTLKKNQSSFLNIFTGKVFYLDANVIFRLIGLNNDERKIVIKSFIDKCKDCKINLKYTNFTYDEIFNTIKNNVNEIKAMLNDKRMLSIDQYEKFGVNISNIAFLKKYYEWSISNDNIYNDFEKFERYLNNEIHDILRSFIKSDFMNYQITDTNLFDKLSASLKYYKSKTNAKVHDNSISIDVNNFLYLKECREKEKGNNFWDLQNYLITTDANLCEWSKTIIPGGIPVCILPSVWYSLILKFKGRTDNDYNAFNLFLNLRYRISNDNLDKRRPQILSIIQNLNESIKYKEKILDQINEQLTNKYLNLTNPDEIIGQAMDDINQHELNKYEINKNEVLKEGELKTYYKIAENEAKDQLKKNNDLYKNIKIFMILIKIISLIIFLTIIIIYTILCIKEKKLIFLDIISIIGLVLPFIITIGISIFKDIILNPFYEKSKQSLAELTEKICNDYLQKYYKNNRS